jgi:serine/threonine protein kinase
VLSVQGRVGRYELVKLLALSHGTTGMVCLAVDARTRQRVVVKLISRRSADDVEGLIAAERRGAVLQDRLSRRSDAVPAVYECGDDDGVFYVAMEHVEGEDLERQIGNGLRLPADTAAQIVRDVCGCLAVAHTPQHLVDGSVRRAIVHADVKPANIRVTPSGRAEAD